MYQQPEPENRVDIQTDTVDLLTNEAGRNQYRDHCVRCSRRTGSVDPEYLHLNNQTAATIVVCVECGFKKFIIWQ